MARKTRVQEAIESYKTGSAEEYKYILESSDKKYMTEEINSIIDGIEVWTNNIEEETISDKPTPEPTNRRNASKVHDSEIVWIHNKQNGAKNAILGIQAKKLARQADTYEIIDNPNKDK